MGSMSNLSQSPEKHILVSIQQSKIQSITGVFMITVVKCTQGYEIIHY